MVRRRLDGYVPYAIKANLYDRGWQGVPAILDKDWKPYLNGEIDMTAAIRRILADYGIDPPAKAATR